MSTLVLTIIASLFVSLISFSGALLLVWGRLMTHQAAFYFLSFAAGTMLAVSFLDILPEALASVSAEVNILMLTLLGIVVFFFLERFILWFHHHDELHGMKPSAILILLGDGLHNLIDGVAIAAAFLTNPALGLATTLAIAAHEIPQEIADFSVLVNGGMEKTRALFFNFLSGLTALGGAVISFLFLENLREFIPLSLAFTAGMFVYIACSDLIPEIHKNTQRQKSWTQFLPFLLGIAALWFLVKVLAR